METRERNNKRGKKREFKSYYVVWKPNRHTAIYIAPMRLNRTM